MRIEQEPPTIPSCTVPPLSPLWSVLSISYLELSSSSPSEILSIRSLLLVEGYSIPSTDWLTLITQGISQHKSSLEAGKQLFFSATCSYGVFFFLAEHHLPGNQIYYKWQYLHSVEFKYLGFRWVGVLDRVCLIFSSSCVGSLLGHRFSPASLIGVCWVTPPAWPKALGRSHGHAIACSRSEREFACVP